MGTKFHNRGHKSHSLYKLRIRESEKLKIVLALYKKEIQQKKAGPDYHLAKNKYSLLTGKQNRKQ